MTHRVIRLGLFFGFGVWTECLLTLVKMGMAKMTDSDSEITRYT